MKVDPVLVLRLSPLKQIFEDALPASMYSSSVYPAGSLDFFAYRQYSVVSPVTVKV